MVISANSAAASVLALPSVRPVVAIAATLNFGYLAYRIAAPPMLSDTRADQHPSQLIAGILLSLANPKAYAAAAALFSGFVLIESAALVEYDFDPMYYVLADCAAARLGASHSILPRR